MTPQLHPKDRIPKEFIITENQLNDLVTGHLDIEDELRIMEFVRSRPASHSASSQRIEQVIKMLEQWKRGEMVDLTDNTWYIEIGSHKIDEAIALLRGEQHE